VGITQGLVLKYLILRDFIRNNGGDGVRSFGVR
jgi:hypothetical protein